MTTVDLLRDVLTHDAESTATPDRVAAARARLGDLPALRSVDDPAVVIADTDGPGPRRWRPVALGLGGLAAAVVAALVVAGFVADRPGAGGTGPAATAPAAALPLTDYAFSVGDDPGGLPFAYQGTASGVQGGVWRASATAPPAAVLDVLTGAGVSPVPVRPADATPLRSGVADGWTAPATAVGLDLFFTIDPADTLTVWRDETTGLWAALLTDGLDAARVRDLVGTVRVGDYHPVRSPLTLRALPAGTHLDAVSEVQGTFQLTFGPHGSQFVVGVGPAGTQVGDGETGTAPPQPLVVGGWRGTYRADDPITAVSDGRVDVVVSWGPGQRPAPGGPTSAMPQDQLTRLLAGLTVADLGDPASWTELATGVPTS